MPGPSPSETELHPPADPLAEWSFDFIKPYEGSSFEVDAGNGETEAVTLVSVTAAGNPAHEGARQPFSLLFRSARRDRYVPQGCRTLRHGQLGEVGIFLVPLGPDETGMRYEAVFN